ncbi:hypothetical protein ACQPW3_22350 [Actinosynnema sp. CA-248983]
MSDISVPSEQALVEAFGAEPVPLAGGEAAYLVEVEAGGCVLVFTYDLVERSVRVRISESGVTSVDLYFEGLDGISITGKGSSTGLAVQLVGGGFRGKVDVAIFPRPGVTSEVLLA